jgi:hypothetical protein
VDSRWSWLALGAGAYLAFTLAMFPASVALRWFAPPEVSLAGAQGTLWSGSAASGIAAGIGLQDVRWRVQPWSLLLGRVSATLEARLPDGFVSTNLAASPRRVRFSDLRGGTSLATLTGLLPIRGTQGQASLALESLEIENGWPSRVVGELKLARLEVAPFIATANQQLLALGDYTVTFTEGLHPIEASFVDNGGPLEVSGTLAVDATRAYELDASIKPRPGAAEQLIQGLAIMTTDPDSSGRRQLNLTGSL